MAQYVAIGTSPDVDTSVVVGPFRSMGKAHDAAEELDALGYISEICTCRQVAELTERDWSDSD